MTSTGWWNCDSRSPLAPTACRADVWDASAGLVPRTSSPRPRPMQSSSSSPTRADLTAAVRAAPLFAALDGDTLDALASSAVVVPLADGEDAFADGVPDG